jgi:ubiquinone/menaquinone biosynthesis C-methylase UbiE
MKAESQTTLERDTVRRPLFANVLYPRFRKAAEASGEHRYRERLLDGLAGRVLELGCGDGAHFRLYPDTVRELVAIEPEENLLERAEMAAADAKCPVRIMPGFAEDLSAADGEFDAAVAALVLCSVDDQQTALGELMRVIRPGGELRFFEHVRADARLHAAAQLAVQPVWAQLGGGCHVARDTEQAIRNAGFEIERIERFEFAPGFLQKLAGPHILGIARRPSVES